MKFRDIKACLFAWSIYGKLFFYESVQKKGPQWIKYFVRSEGEGCDSYGSGAKGNGQASSTAEIGAVGISHAFSQVCWVVFEELSTKLCVDASTNETDSNLILGFGGRSTHGETKRFEADGLG